MMHTAFVTDARFSAHTLPDHPEHAGRLTAVERSLHDEHLLEHLLRLEARLAGEQDLLAVHTPAYLAKLANTARQPLTLFGLDTYVVSASYLTAQLAAGAALQAVDVVMTGQAHHALAAIRPPGHHATASAGMGFCLLNNVAIAARYAQRVYGLRRVLIVDYDVHHGNGTQAIFYADPTVFYISTHESPLYPGTGAIYETGDQAGAGYTLNIPLPAGVGDEGYTRVFEKLVIPAARRFEPELVLVSVGFDAHWADPLAHMQLSLTGYHELARALLALSEAQCAGRIVFVMEGGYHLQALGCGWANLARLLSGEQNALDPLGPARHREPEVEPIIERVRRLHKLD